MNKVDASVSEAIQMSCGGDAVWAFRNTLVKPSKEKATFKFWHSRAPLSTAICPTLRGDFLAQGKAHVHQRLLR